MLYACGVVHVAQNLMTEGGLYLLAALVEHTELGGREVVEVVAVGTHEMGEDRTRDDGRLLLQAFDELINLRAVEAQAVHAGVKLQMYGPPRDTLGTGCLDEGIHQSEAIDLRLQVVVEEGLKRRHLGVHHNDILRDAGIAKGDTLVGYRHCQIVHAMVLQRLGNLHGTSAISVGLDHTHHLGLGLQERAEIVQVIDHRIEVHLEDGLVHLLFQQLGDTLEAKRTGAFQQHYLVIERTEQITLQELLHVVEEPLLTYLYLRCLTGYLWADTDKTVYAALQNQVGHLTIELRGRLTRLVDITQNQGLLDLRIERRGLRFILNSTVHEVEGDVEGVDIAVVRVVDEGQTTLSLLHLQTHGDRLQLRHPLGNLLWRQP